MIPLKLRLENFIAIVAFIADKEFQHKVWVKKLKGISGVDTIGELYSIFFEGNAIDQFIDEELSTSPLTKLQKEAILQFTDALNVYYEYAFRRTWWKKRLKLIKSESELIHEPEWNELIQLAISTKKLFPEVNAEYDFSKDK